MNDEIARIYWHWSLSGRIIFRGMITTQNSVLAQVREDERVSDFAPDVDTPSSSLIPADIVSPNLSVARLSPQSIPNPSPSAGSDTLDINSYPDYVHLESIETDLTPTRFHPAPSIFERLKNLYQRSQWL